MYCDIPTHNTGMASCKYASHLQAIHTSQKQLQCTLNEMCAEQGGNAQLLIGTTSKQPVLDVTPEIFTLRKLLPQTADYDFNVHIMDFKPGEYLYVKV